MFEPTNHNLILQQVVEFSAIPTPVILQFIRPFISLQDTISITEFL